MNKTDIGKPVTLTINNKRYKGTFERLLSCDFEHAAILLRMRRLPLGGHVEGTFNKMAYEYNEIMKVLLLNHYKFTDNDNDKVPCIEVHEKAVNICATEFSILPPNRKVLKKMCLLNNIELKVRSIEGVPTRCFTGIIER